MKTLPTFSGRRASQNRDELLRFTTLLAGRQVRRYIEIGARDGDTFHAVMSSLPSGSVGVAIDFPGGAWGYSDSASNLQAAAADLRSKGYQILVVLGDSSASETYAQVEDFIETTMSGALFDAAFIDADHRYEAVKADYEIWGALAEIVAFHDIAGQGVIQKTSGLPVEVPKFWDEIKRSRPSVEIIDEDSLMGIGVLL